MKFKILFVIGFISTSINAAEHKAIHSIGEYIQSIQLVNLLANNLIKNVGMTPTSIIVKYYDDTSTPCWIATLQYQDDYTIHAGPTQGCRNKISRIEICPQLVFNKLNVYQGQVSINLDVEKYVYQVNVIQESAPQFDPQNGMVIKSGTLTTKIQSE